MSTARGTTPARSRQRDQSLPPTAYKCPVPGTGSDGFAPVPADVGQRDDWSGIGKGDESGGQRDDLGREAVYGPQEVPQGNDFMEDIFGSLLQSVDLENILSKLEGLSLVRRTLLQLPMWPPKQERLEPTSTPLSYTP